MAASESHLITQILADDRLVTCQAGEWLAGGGLADHSVRRTSPGMFYTCGNPEQSLFFISGTIQPIRGNHGDMACFTRRVVDQRVPPMSVHGRRELVTELWTVLSRQWGKAREIRQRQQLLALTDEIDPSKVNRNVRRMTGSDFERYLPAAIAMYREELDADPMVVENGLPFRHRVARSLARGRSWGLVEDGRIIFKADVSAESARVAQIQGVWVHPDCRSQGVGSGAMAAVLSALSTRGVTPTLVVNEENKRAMSMYRRLGMSPAAEYATILTS